MSGAVSRVQGVECRVQVIGSRVQGVKVMRGKHF